MIKSIFVLKYFHSGKKFTLLLTTLLSWFVGFVLMWLVIGNMGVLLYGLLFYAIKIF